MIYEAICNSNPRLARKCMVEHLDFAESAMAKTLKIEPKFASSGNAEAKKITNT